MYRASKLMTVTLSTLLLVTGCSSFSKDSKPVQNSTAANAQGSSYQRCDSSAVNNLVGKKINQQQLEQARQAAGAQTARILTPRSVVTLEFNSTRLNIHVDDGGTVTLVSCG